jgi:hypothetical protein
MRTRSSLPACHRRLGVQAWELYWWRVRGVWRCDGAGVGVGPGVNSGMRIKQYVSADDGMSSGLNTVHRRPYAFTPTSGRGHTPSQTQ